MPPSVISCNHCKNKSSKWNRIRIPLGLAMLLLAGCAPSPKATLEASKDSLKQAVFEKALSRDLEQKLNLYSQNLDEKLEDEIGKEHVNNLTPGFSGYGISGDRVYIKETKIDYSFPGEQVFAPAAFKRKYLIINSKWTIQTVKFSPPKKYSEGDYTQKSTITISVKPSYSMRFAYGMTVHMLTPGNFNTLTDSKRENWTQQCATQLPFGESDHAIAIAAKPEEILPQREMERELYQLKLNVDAFELHEDVFFNTHSKQWELKEQTQLKQLRPIPQHNLQEGTPVPQGFRAITLTKDGEKQELILGADDCEIVEKLNSGMFYINGKWVDREIYQQTQKLTSILKQFKGKSFSWTAMRELAQNIRENEKAAPKLKANAIAILEYTLQKQIELDRSNKKNMEAFVLELQHPDFNIIGAEQTADMIKKCQNNVDRLKAAAEEELKKQEEENRKRIAADIAKSKAYLTDLLEKLKKIKELLPEKIATAHDIAKESGLFEEDDFKKQFNILLHLHGVNRKHPRAIEELHRNNWVIGDYSLRIACRSCGGKGKALCRNCRNSGICPICKGAGSRERRVPSQHGFDFHVTRVSCPSECTYCEGQKKICIRCQGTGGYINRKVLQEAIPAETARTIERLDLYITKAEKELEKLKK